jgi:riboflavin biosynthesis pyrimidine reductase
MQQHFAEREPSISTSNKPAGPQPVHVARRARSYTISVDTVGRLRWPDGDLDGDHLICVVSERAPGNYLSMPRDRGIPYVVSGAMSVDLVQAIKPLGEHFEIRTLLLEGGGCINRAFLEADLVDELSLLVLPGIDGRQDTPTVFDGVSPARNAAVPLKLKSQEQGESATLWIRYQWFVPKGVQYGYQRAGSKPSG